MIASGLIPKTGCGIQTAARLSGLSPHVIRIWERRYGAVAPERSATNRRIYHPIDIERLSLLKRATDAGHSIGRIARLPREELASLGAGAAAASFPATDTPGEPGRDEALTPEAFVDRAIAAVRSMDEAKLESILHHAAASMSRPVLFEKALRPFMARIGTLWWEGDLRVGHEHLASATVRSFLGGMNRFYLGGTTPQLPVDGESRRPGLDSASRSFIDSAPVALFTTPPGQLHELGALFAAVTASSDGWRALYLGPNLPVEEIAHAACQGGARVVALSLTYPGDDPLLPDELVRLRRWLPEGVAIIAGGQAADGYRNTLETIGAIRVTDMRDFRNRLASLRQ